MITHTLKELTPKFLAKFSAYHASLDTNKTTDKITHTPPDSIIFTFEINLELFIKERQVQRVSRRVCLRDLVELTLLTIEV